MSSDEEDTASVASNTSPSRRRASRPPPPKAATPARRPASSKGSVAAAAPTKAARVAKARPKLARAQSAPAVPSAPPPRPPAAAPPPTPAPWRLHAVSVLTRSPPVPSAFYRRVMRRSAPEAVFACTRRCVARLQEDMRLASRAGPAGAHATLRALSLLSAVNMTVRLLKATGVGKTVARLRKHGCVRALARSLSRARRSRVRPRPARAPSAATGGCRARRGACGSGG